MLSLTVGDHFDSSFCQTNAVFLLLLLLLLFFETKELKVLVQHLLPG